MFQTSHNLKPFYLSYACDHMLKEFSQAAFL